MSQLGTNESLALTIKGLLNGESVTALNSGKYLSTRISNNIVELRQKGLEIITNRIKLDNGKHYGAYILVDTPLNIEKAVQLIEYYQNRTAE